MQNPKKKLDQGSWYEVASNAVLHQTNSSYSPSLGLVPAGSLVLFLEYHSGSVRTCKVMHREMIGWIVVSKKYKSHLHFFKKINMMKEEGE